MTTATEPRRAVTLMLKGKRLGFADLAEPRSINGGKPSYGARIIVEQDDADVKAIDAAIKEVAEAQWKDKAGTVLDLLEEKGRIAFSKKPYRNSKGEVYKAFEGKFSLGVSAPTTKRPTYFDEYGNPIDSPEKVAAKLYAGCYVNMKVEFYPLLRDDGNRINCAVLGVMFSGDGESFGGGAPVASADDFSGMAKERANADDLL